MATTGVEVVDVVSARDSLAVAQLCKRPDVDLISVHSPPYLHRVHCELALQEDHSVLCDKPFTNSVRNAAALIVAAENRDGVHLVNFEFRCDPVRQRVAQLLIDDAIGTIEHVHWVHFSAGSRVPMRQHGWLFESDAGGGWIGAWGSHAIDTLRWWFGELEVVSSTVDTIVPERPTRDGAMRAVDVEDAFSANLRAKSSGASIVIDSSFAAVANLAPRITIYGSEGVIEILGERKLDVRHVDGTRESIDVDGERPAGVDPHAGPMGVWAQVIRDAVESGVVLLGAPTFSDGMAGAKLLDGIRSKAKRKRLGLA
jgi:predicted dehydrogenase